ncbi:acetolactate synthase catalytic subunit [Pelagibius litoralis]|uniref:Acetolactate synthase catalytic subunit n=1 Tax=Pelagibius litoralis TaxID=374515 RepID=A0A967EZN7_9PROT|nr:acetolactate synthase catalytic subunit [Pelagibius litoralis]NIA70428.1 acetolactate synthase catalytic subunit [Pelagibius litoralis]
MRTTQKTQVTVAQSIARALMRHGVELTFGQSLPSLVQLSNTDLGIRQIAYRTENAGTYMADGYARVSHRVAVVTAQNGPAATLLVPGLAEALKASVPIVAIVQDVPVAAVDKNAFQELDHIKLFDSCTKWVRRVTDPTRVDDYIDMAFTAAASGRPGPAVILLPADLQSAAASVDPVRNVSLGHYPLDRVTSDSSRIRQAAEMVSEAEHPLIVAGGGVHISGAHDVLADIQEQFGIPVATTAMGKGAVGEFHPLTLGVVGYFMGKRGATRYMRPIIDRADVILLVGTRTNQNATDSWSLFPPTARYIHLDPDPQEIGRNYESLRLVGDAKLTLEALKQHLSALDLGRRYQARAVLEQEIVSARTRHRDETLDVAKSDLLPLRPERLMTKIQDHLTAETVVVADASYSSIWIANYLRSLAPGMRFITPRGMAGLGWGFPMALGAKLANPESPVLAIVGDGGFAHVWSELETACRMDIAVTVVVLNNRILGYQQDAEDVKFGRHTDACGLNNVDHAQIARACGCEGQRISNIDEFSQALADALRSHSTTVLDVEIDPAAYPPITMFDGYLDSVRTARALDDGKRDES